MSLKRTTCCDQRELLDNRPAILRNVWPRLNTLKLVEAECAAEFPGPVVPPCGHLQYSYKGVQKCTILFFNQYNDYLTLCPLEIKPGPAWGLGLHDANC